jgi:3-oxoacyl-[acyl-carrier protein] reductase
VGLLDGKSAVITGGAQGIGLEIARVLGGEGARLLLGDLNEDGAVAAAEGLAADGIEAIAQRADVTSEAEMSALVDRSVAAFGGIDVMVNNAGITRDKTMRNMSLDDFRAVIDVHLVGCWLGTKFASIAMREQKRGSIVNISSISGKVGNIGQTNYSTAKAGMIGLTKAAAKEVAYLGVRVNAVQPGLIRTAMAEALSEEIIAQKIAEVPMGRIGETREVANVVLFLASDLSSYMTGTVLEITGGRYM